MIDQPEFVKFRKIPRLNRECIITEKIDGTNAQIFIDENDKIWAGSRNRWLTPEKDNFGFAQWVKDNENDLFSLGSGHHFGEWWGKNIQRSYELTERRFSLFYVEKWQDNDYRPLCCSVVPVLYKGKFNTLIIKEVLRELKISGSQAEVGYMNPEGIVILHKAASQLFKVTLKNDSLPKGSTE